MRPKRRVLIVLLPILFLGAFAWIISHPREPEYQGKSLSQWMERYRNPGGFSPEPLADNAVRQIGTNAIPELLRMLRAQDSDLKFKFLKLAFKYHMSKVEPDPASIRCIKASYAFSALGMKASNAVPALIEIYEQGNYTEAKRHVAGILSGFGPAAKPAVPALLRGLSHTNDWVRRTATVALGQIHAEPETVVPALIKCLGDPDWNSRIIAADVLGKFGADARPAVPALQQSLQDTRMTLVTARSIKQIAPEIYSLPEILMPALINCLKTPDAVNQVWAACALVSFGTNARPALSALTPLLVNRNPVVRLMVARAIKNIAPEIQSETEPVVPALLRLLKDSDVEIRKVAASALGFLGDEARPAVPALILALNDGDGVVRVYAESALSQIDPEALAKAKADRLRTNNASGSR